MVIFDVETLRQAIRDLVSLMEMDDEHKPGTDWYTAVEVARYIADPPADLLTLIDRKPEPLTFTASTAEASS